MNATCQCCDGSGTIYDHDPKGQRCPECGGSGTR